MRRSAELMYSQVIVRRVVEARRLHYQQNQATADPALAGAPLAVQEPAEAVTDDPVALQPPQDTRPRHSLLSIFGTKGVKRGAPQEEPTDEPKENASTSAMRPNDQKKKPRLWKRLRCW